MSAGPDARTGRITDDLAAVLAPLSVAIDDVSVTAVGKRRLVRVMLDRDVSNLDGDTTSVVEPLSLDEIGDLTRVVSDRLDEIDAMGEQPYVLEVSSPGVERPLTQPRHFRRNVGRLLEVTTASGDKHTGRLTEVRADGIRLEGAVKGEITTLDLTYDQVAKAKVQVEFNRPARSGRAEGEDD